MAYKTSAGGKSQFSIYLISADHGTITTPAALTVEAVVTTSKTGNGVTVDHIKSDTDLWDFINTYGNETASTATTTEAESVILDNESVTAGSSGSGSSSQNFLMISDGATNGDGVKCQAFLGTAGAEMGAHTQEAKKFDRPSLPFDLVNALQDVTCSVAASILDGTIYDAAATFDIPTGKNSQTKFLTAA